MTNEEPNFVELCDEEGNITKCEVYDIVDFEEKTYALLLPLDDETEEDPELIVLEYLEEGEECYFQNIEDEDEFERICEYIESLADSVEE